MADLDHEGASAHQQDYRYQGHEVWPAQSFPHASSVQEGTDKIEQRAALASLS